MQTVGSEQSLRPRSTAQQIYEMLRHDIVLGVVKPGETIREPLIAERLSVSRTPVREAVQRLAVQGLVDIFPQSGTRVAPIRAEKVRTAQLIREAVEVEIVRRACITANESDFAAMAGAIEDQISAANRNDRPRLFETDEEFHRAIFRAAGHLQAGLELDEIKIHLDRMRYLSHNWPRGTDHIIGEHETIYNAVRRRDSDGAARAMTLHLRTVLMALDLLLQHGEEESMATYADLRDARV